MATLGFALALAWLWAQDETSNSDSDAAPADKWVQISENNRRMLKSLETIETNLNFVKNRSMSGGKR